MVMSDPFRVMTASCFLRSRDWFVRLGGMSITEQNISIMVCVFTIGHGTRAIEEFIVLLRAAGIERLVEARLPGVTSSSASQLGRRT